MTTFSECNPIIKWHVTVLIHATWMNPKNIMLSKKRFDMLLIYDSIGMTFLELANLQRKKVN